MALLDPITITFTRSDNETKSFSGRPSNSEPFGITELIGFEFPEVEVFTQPRGLGDGVFFTGQRLNGRTVEIHLKQNERYPQDFFDGWNGLKSFFNPTFTFQIQVDNSTSGSVVTRYLNDCRLLAAQYQLVNASEPNPELIVQMMAPSAMFEASLKSDTIAYTDGVPTVYTYPGEARTEPYLNFTCLTTDGSAYFDVTMNGATARLDVGQALQVGDLVSIDPQRGTYSLNAGVPFLIDATQAAAVYENWWLIPGTGQNTFTIQSAAGATFEFGVSFFPEYLGI